MRSVRPYPPSSPSIAILKDGKLVYMMERREIENQGADAIAARTRPPTRALRLSRPCRAAQPPACTSRGAVRLSCASGMSALA
ncbi:MAG: BrxA/BrxB family bacilliredoxin [Vicinamibacterales bacterium]